MDNFGEDIIINLIHFSCMSRVGLTLISQFWGPTSMKYDIITVSSCQTKFLSSKQLSSVWIQWRRLLWCKEITHLLSYLFICLSWHWCVSSPYNLWILFQCDLEWDELYKFWVLRQCDMKKEMYYMHIWNVQKNANEKILLTYMSIKWKWESDKKHCPFPYSSHDLSTGMCWSYQPQICGANSLDG